MNQTASKHTGTHTSKHYRPASNRRANDNKQAPMVVTLSRVLRNNITADSLRHVAAAQRGERGKEQRRALRELAYEVEQERGW